ncbi:MAG: outer membrane protein assembly factor [marine benthic group bacterium]|nr:outer membrane protein assembly factor [Gemmatimonadota bacterium]
MLALLLAPAAVLNAQETPTHESWNGGRTIALVESAIEARRHAWGDSALTGFNIYAEGHVHYLADFGGAAGQQAIRADQVALELRWRRGLGSMQEIVGRQETEWFPTKLHYHIDHLTLVVDNYGDRIRVGEGDEIRHAPHPLAPGALSIYEYRLVDSLAMALGGEWKRLYRLEVRPLDSSLPAVIGTMDLERSSSALTRLAVGFTPASYVDPRLVDVSIELENALVLGRWWLPSSQRVEIRRRLEYMELPFGSTIRASFRVFDYDLEPKGRGGVVTGHHVRARPDSELRRYAGWRMPEVDAWPEEVTTDSISMAEVRSQATSIARDGYLGGNAPLRLYIPNVSSAFRVRRAEGVYLGAGARWEPSSRVSLDATAGWAFGRGAGELRAGVQATVGSSTLRLDGWINELSDIGPFEASSGIVSTMGATFRGDDWTDPYFRSGGRLGVRTPLGPIGRGDFALVAEHQEGAELELDPVGSATARAVRPVTEGTDLRIELGIERGFGSWAGSQAVLNLRGQLSGAADFGYTRWHALLTTRPEEPDATWSWEAALGAGVGTGSLPEQQLLLLGGRGTVPGYEFRPFAGDVAAFLNGAVSRSVWSPWIRIRGIAAAGWTDLGDPGSEAAARFGARATGNVRTSLGAGLGLFYDLVRLDVARGLSEGEWEWMVSVTPAFRPPL